MKSDGQSKRYARRLCGTLETNMINPDEQLKNDRELEAKTAEESLQKSNEDLLKEIFYCSTAFLEHGTNKTSRTFAYFSSLLVNLSQQAEKSTKKIIYLTWAIIVLTIFLSVIATIQVKIMIKQNRATQIQYKQTRNNDQTPKIKETFIQSEIHK